MEQSTYLVQPRRLVVQNSITTSAMSSLIIVIVDHHHDIVAGKQSTVLESPVLQATEMIPATEAATENYTEDELDDVAEVVVLPLVNALAATEVDHLLEDERPLVLAEDVGA